MTEHTQAFPEIYQGQFGEFTITDDDRRSVVLYRAALMVAALSFGIGTGLVLWQGNTPWVLNWVTWLYAIFWLALGSSLWLIHIYLQVLHRILQTFWAIGGIATLAIALQSSEPLALTIYQQPLTLLGAGFTFAALTGIFFKEAFCFNRLETKLLTPLVPILLMGHLLTIFPVSVEQSLLAIWALLFGVFAVRKVIQAIPPDIGDKSVFDYLKAQRLSSSQ
ncbi:MAG: DUF2301 domain-containing membrane protein [Scytolyngbya sp. HA4215-MV1]|nr:DUF2301 domain-containing membrane protein [Scytolyngbya sp. HA4215-MV1]